MTHNTELLNVNPSVEAKWVQAYGNRVPRHLVYPDKTMPELLDDVVEKFPNRTAVIFLGREMTYTSFKDKACRFAQGLIRAGLKPGDRVCLYLPNTPHMLVAYYGTLMAGGVAVPTNPLYTIRELRHQVKDSGSRILVTLDLSLTMEKVIPLEQEGLFDKIIVGSIPDYLPFFTRPAYKLLKGRDLATIPDRYTYLRYDRFLADSSPAKPRVKLSLDNPAVLMYTGGTTGLSKGATLTHRNIMSNAVQTSVWSKGSAVRDFAHDCVLVILPLFHSFSMTVCMNRAIYGGESMLLFPQRPRKDLLDMLKVIKRHQPTILVGVPTLFTSMVNQPKSVEYGVQSIRLCNSGAAPLPMNIIRRFEEMTGSVIIEGYGLSEASPVTHCNPLDGEQKAGSVGVPISDTESILFNHDAGRQAEPGEEGELLIRGPQVMKGYWNRPEDTANSLKNGWLHTGDIATMDENGYLTIVDRLKDMIITSGYNIYPREIEEVLHEHEAVLEVAVVGVTDRDKGERVKAYVVLKEGQKVEAEDIVTFCKARLAPYKVPKFVEFMDEIPKNNAGKVVRRLLREQPQNMDSAADCSQPDSTCSPAA